jgi:hypothetical protein
MTNPGTVVTVVIVLLYWATIIALVVVAIRYFARLGKDVRAIRQLLEERRSRDQQPGR